MSRAEGRQARQGGARGGIRRFFTWKKMLGTFLGVCLLGMAGFIGLYMYVDVPEANAEAEFQSNVYKYSDGSILTRTGKLNREIVGLDRMPKDVRNAFVAAENKSFYKDKGVDLKGTARGLLNTVRGQGKQGGSTITQQYVKNYYLTHDQTVSRKLKELVIALKVDQQKSKDHILAGYMNTAFYGRSAYGIQAAAQAYYGVDSEDLTVEQGAYLAALLQAPNQYDWAIATDTGKKLAKERWNYVLDNMVGEGWLDAGARAGMTFPEPEEPKPVPGQQGQVGYLVEAANQQLRAKGVSQAEIEAGGWTITLNIDKKKQKQLEKAAKGELTDALKPDSNKVDAAVQAGAASVDPKTGQVLALYGGVDYTKHYRSNATRTDYQPASTFKPVILAAALEHEAETQDGEPITADAVYNGDSETPVEGSDVAYAPPNQGDADYGPVTVQKAMNKSVNSVFAQMGVDVGMDKVMKMADTLGMDVEGQQAVPAQALGTMGASPLQMAGVYATFANHGKKVNPAVVRSAEHISGKVDLGNPIGDQVISRSTADSVTSVLTGVVNDGTGAAVRNARQAVAGKTGTSDNFKSAWFVGFTPKLVTAVGLFGEAPPSEGGKQVSLRGMTGTTGLGNVAGGSFPAQIWAAYTFGVMGAPTKFDLDTSMGSAVRTPQEPTPSSSSSPTPSETPSSEPPTTAPPTTEPPTTAPPTTEPPTTPPPTLEPTEKPTPTFEPPEPTQPDPDPSDEPTYGIPQPQSAPDGDWPDGD
ncbi:transglycosylase domain-containing protein [Streptomyces apocyni]|uniref:transglycosylase domain-containing protein n=1 Tax=Streptomyces apocyni TaxID=2654677 RepID=UPI0012E998E6|nr:transglycosylase domain-containing protein [Streptomyces apocyni]